MLELDKNGNPISQKKAIVTSEIWIYPNPTEGNIIVNTGNLTIKQLVIFNMSGKMIYNANNSSFDTFIKLDLSFLSRGMYIIDLVDDNNSHYKAKISLY